MKKTKVENIGPYCKPKAATIVLLFDKLHEIFDLWFFSHKAPKPLIHALKYFRIL
jgi:hypothetical protein